MIWMGTDGTSPDLKAGDVVEVEITGLGTLRNRSSAPAASRLDVQHRPRSAVTSLPPMLAAEC